MNHETTIHRDRDGKPYAYTRIPLGIGSRALEVCTSRHACQPVRSHGTVVEMMPDGCLRWALGQDWSKTLATGGPRGTEKAIRECHAAALAAVPGFMPEIMAQYQPAAA